MDGSGARLRGDVGHVRAWLGAIAIAVVAVLAISTSQVINATSLPPVVSVSDSVPLYSKLGALHRDVGTRSEAAQRYFDQGLRLHFAANRVESIRAFREAQRRDELCLMCVVGEAIAYGPTIDSGMDAVAEGSAIAATRRATTLLTSTRNATPELTQWVRAIAARYVNVPGSTRAMRDSSYALAMARFAHDAPRDMDVLAMAADAAMIVTNGKYWRSNGELRSDLARPLKLLSNAVSLAPMHAGLCHAYIHLVEARYPVRALPCAHRVANDMPAAGHLVHLPAMLSIRAGRWADAVTQNAPALHADHDYMSGPRARDAEAYAVSHQVHNHHMNALASVMAGASATALDCSRRVVAIVTPKVARQNPSLEPLLALPAHTLLSFGRWDAVLREPLPPRDLRVALAHAWTARGIAFAAQSRRAEARAALDSIEMVMRALAIGEARSGVEIAARVLRGEIALLSEDVEGAVRDFRLAAAMDSALSFTSAPRWYYASGQALGKALLRAGRPAAAEHAYRNELLEYPENGRTLRGLARALTAQGRIGDAGAVQRRSARAWRSADVASE